MKNKQSGFTLLEILLVVGIISILAGIVIVAINPSKQLATVRNTERKSDIKQIDSAITQYYIDEFKYPPTITSDLKEICNTGPVASTTEAVDTTSCGTLVNLSNLVPMYFTAVPKDPQATSTGNGTGYYIKQDSITHKIGTKAELAELDQDIVIGMAASSSGTGGGACVATGGSIDTDTAPGYAIHTFTSSGSFVVTSGNCNAEVLVVAGGGGGGSQGGGGGAGGLVYNSGFSITSRSYDVTVGAGGPGGLANVNDYAGFGTNGEDSVFSTLIATGGGGGASPFAAGAPGRDGGSGGGGGAYGGVTATGGSGTSGQGNDGGASEPNANYGMGGGGGAGGVGGTGSSSTGGDGGIGVNYSISGSVVCYAGGGGGGMITGGGTAGIATCGGSDGSLSNGQPSAATDGTGGGGGGAGEIADKRGGHGGSGIVIIKYPIVIQ